jgi:transcriptional regulator with XRE-family HTH domain
MKNSLVIKPRSLVFICAALQMQRSISCGAGVANHCGAGADAVQMQRSRSCGAGEHILRSWYETKNVQPPADVLKRMADVFGTSIDYIVNGNINEKAQNSIKDSKLLQHFKAIENMEEDDKNVVLKLIDAFITKRKVQQLAS